jgi:hypothetical protein
MSNAKVALVEIVDRVLDVAIPPIIYHKDKV